MKPALLAVLLLTSRALASEPLALPSFAETKVGTPPLSLLDSTKTFQPQLPFVGRPSHFPNWTIGSDRPASRVVSRMPIIVPQSVVDAKMPILPPDPTIDYKLIVKTPAVESVR